jgi:hypothetical protein
MSRIHTFEKRQCVRCWHRSAVKNTPPPPFHSQSPSLPPPYPTPPPLLPSAGKTGSSSGEKGLSLSEGLGKEYMTWHETLVGKTGTQAEGRHVVPRACQG